MTGRLPWPVRASAAAWILASTADNFVVFTLFWLAEPLGWSSLQTALVVLLTRGPALLGGSLVGRAVDRWGPRTMLVVDGIARGLLMLGFVVSSREGLDVVPAVVLGAAAAVLAPASYAAVRTLVPRIVPAGSLGRANAWLAVGDQLPLVLAAALIGPSLETFGVAAAFCVPAVLMGLVVVIGLLLPRTEVPPDDDGGGGDHAGAVGSPWRTPGVLPLVALSVAYFTVYGPFEPVSAPFVREDLAGGPNAYSLIWATFGIGAVLTLPLAPLLARRRPGVVNALNAVLWGLAALPFAFVDGVPAAVVVALVAGAVWGPYTAVETTALQRWAPARTHGRLFGAQRALLQAASPVGAAVGVVALDVTSPAVVLATSAVACSVAGLVALSRPSIRDRV